MEKILKLILAILLFVFVSCGKSNQNNSDEGGEIIDNIDEGFADGEYCAEIEYYNPNTGTSSTYTLPVEVEYGKLVKINWTNGGWLDDSHFIEPDISDGDAEFTSDAGYQYKVKLLNDSDCSQSSSSFTPENGESPIDNSTEEDSYYKEDENDSQQNYDESENSYNEDEETQY